MNFSIVLVFAAVATSLLCAVFSFALARGPGWHALTWFGAVCLASAGLVLATLPEHGIGPRSFVDGGASLSLSAGALQVYFWIRYGAAQIGRPISRVERALSAVLAACAIAGVVPGALARGAAEARPNAWWPGEHWSAPATPLGYVAFLALLAAASVVLAGMVAAHRAGTRYLLGPSFGLGLVLLATVHDALAADRVYEAPSLTEVAVIALMTSVGLGVTMRVVESARSLMASRAALQRAQADLVVRERLAALGELSAVVAHEVRNPLGVIYNAVAMLRRNRLSTEDADAALSVVQEEAERLNRLVGDLLQFARPRAPSLEEVATKQLLESASESAARALSLPLTSVVVEVGEGAEALRCDEALMLQAVGNLVSNALLSEGRTTAARVGARRRGDDIEVTVSDDGAGVPEGDRHRVFEPFFTTRATGTGLGLAIVRKVAREHGGEATLERSPAGGATFVVSIPSPAP